MMMEQVEPSEGGRLVALQRAVERPLLRMHATPGMANDPCLLLLLAKLALPLIKTLFVEEEEEEEQQHHQEELRFAEVAERPLQSLAPC